MNAQLLKAWIAVTIQRTAARSRDEEGITTLEYVILGALLAAGTIAIGVLIVQKFTDKAGSIPTG